MALNAYNFAAVPTGFDLAPPLDQLITPSGIDVVRSATQKAYPDAQGFQVRVNGVGLTYDAAGHFTGGVITSIQVVAIDQFNNVTVQEQTTGFAVLAVNYQNNFNVSPLDAIKLVMAGNDAVIGDNLGDNLFGHAGNDTLIGNGGDDTMTGGAGDDSYNGGAGFDTVDFSDSYNNPLAVKGIQAVLGANNINDWQGNNEATVSVERVIGTQFSDLFIGSIPNETFLGLGGADNFVGNAGVDTVDYSLDAKFGGNAGVTANLTTGNGVDGFGNTDQYSGIENLTGSDQNDTLTGNNGINVLRGLGGNDTIDGVAGGFDVMAGGKGDDTYIYSSNNQIVDETRDGGDGTDEVKTSVSINLLDPTRFIGNIENVTLTGAAAISAIGNNLDNVMTGNDGANFLSGQSGSDTVNGGGGNDVLAGDGGDDKMDGGVGDDNMNGGTGNDTMAGGIGDDRMLGGDGNDRLDGGSGQNHLEGGAGDDTYVVADHGFIQDEITDSSGQHDSIDTSVTRDLRDYSGIEDATISGAAAANLTGTDGANILNGGAGDNVLFGLGGDDTINGGGGNDQMFGGNGDDTMSGGDGNDTGFGGGGHNTFFGQGGNDTFNGGGGDTFDFADGGDGDDFLTGSAGNDQLLGGGGNDHLVGGLGRDILTGDAGNDSLNGGRGNDVLTGGAGRDSFRFDYKTPADRDVIRDFSHADDTILLNKAVFTGMGSGVLKAQFFHAGTKAHDANDHIIYNKANGAIYYDSDGNHAHAQVLIGVLANHPTNITANDFVLV
jgi:serralysin